MPVLGDYAVFVRVDGFSVKEHNGYVRLKPNTTYSLMLKNNTNTRCDAQVTIDGASVGVFRIAPNWFTVLERPQSEAKNFCFVLAGSAGSGITRGTTTNGLISVKFTPEETRSTLVPRSTTWCGNDMESYGSHEKNTYIFINQSQSVPIGAEGGTALRGHSDQEFVAASHLVYDATRQVTIHLRLVGTSMDNEITPLHQPQSTPIPPPVYGC
jgi:hypothetical protein